VLIDYITATILRSGKENPWMLEVTAFEVSPLA